MAAFALLALASTAALSTRSEASEVARVCPAPPPASARVEAEATQGPIKIDLYVTIPASRLTFRHALELAPGTTAVGAAKAAYKVEQGLVCCDSRDVKAINGLAMDPYKDKWWVVLINGNMQNSSPRTILKSGDVVEWRYEEKKSYDAAHVRLEDWVQAEMAT